MEFKDYLKKLRTDRGWTQTELAEKLDPPHSFAAVTMWEGGKAKPRVGTLQQLARLFGVTVAELIGETPPSMMVGASAFMPLVATTHMGEFDSDKADRTVEVPKSVADNHPRGYVVHGFGSCMNKQLPEDAVLVIDPDLLPRNGSIVLAENEDYGSIVRTYFKGSDTLILSASSYSDEYKDIVVAPADPPVKILGVVVWYQASEDVTYG